MPAVSVVVPFFDSAAFIARCAESLMAQEGVVGGFEVIFVDNGSSDASRGIVESFARCWHGISLLREEKPGAYAARNLGISSARAPLVAFTDADCEVAPDWLASMQRAVRDPRVAVLVGQCRYPGRASLLLRLLGAYENAKTEYVLTRCPAEYHFAYANNMAVRASVFAELGPFAEWRRAADSELVHRLAQHRPDQRVVYDHATRVTHLEFERARARLSRLRLYTGTNSRISTFRELGPLQRIRLVLRAIAASVTGWRSL